MSDVTRILSAIEQGDPHAAEQLLPLVYDELRELAAAKLSQEKPGQTLQATALVHEAYLRLVDAEQAQHWDSRGHFFAAAAEAMRRILIDHARRKQASRYGGGRRRVELAEVELAGRITAQEMLDLEDALGKLAQQDPTAAELVKLRVFAGMSVEQADPRVHEGAPLLSTRSRQRQTTRGSGGLWRNPQLMGWIVVI